MYVAVMVGAVYLKYLLGWNHLLTSKRLLDQLNYIVSKSR